MALPENDEATAAPEISVDETYDAVKTGLTQARPDAAADMDAMMAEIIPQLGELNVEQLDALIMAIKFLNDNPEDYAKNIAEMISEDIIDEGDFPAEFDPEFLATILTVLIEAKRSKQGAETGMAAQMPEPQGFAQGGIADAVRIVASQGRNGDTMLAHINPEEARMLKRAGGSGTINPETGLREYFLKKLWKTVTAPFKAVAKVVKSVFKAVVGVAKKIVSSPIGRIVATIGLTMIGVPPPLASMLVTKAGGGSWKDAIIAGATSYLGGASSPISGYIGKAAGALGVTSAAGQAALGSGVIGTGMNLLSGQKFSDAIKGGITSSIMAAGTTALAAPASETFDKVKTLFGPAEAVAQATTPGTLQPTTTGFGGVGTDQGVMGNAPVAGPTPVSSGMGPDGSGLRMPGSPAPTALAGTDYGLTAPSTAPGGMYDLASRYTSPMGAGALTGGTAGSGAGAVGTGGPIPVPGIMDSASTMGKGIMQMLPGTEGTFGGGLTQLGEGAKGMFAPGPSSADVATRTAELRSSGMTAAEAAKQVASEGPGIIRSYGPGIAAGIGAMGLMGGFTPGQLQPSELQQKLSGTPGMDLINADPSKYLVQGLPGVQYGPSGNIIGSTPINYNIASPVGGGAPMSSIQYQTPGIGQLASQYNTPMGAAGAQAGPINQPYNNPSMYSNLMPQTRAYGGEMRSEGIASLAAGGYPRRTGQISGPGTEKSDDIPAMLSDGEFVMTAKAVRGAGKGSRRAGAKQMYALMHQLEKNASRG